MRIDDDLMIKRLETRPGCIVVNSDNDEKYNKPFDIKKDDEVKSFQVYGRMV